MSQGYVEISFPSTIDSGDLLAALTDGDALGAWEEEGVVHLYWPIESWTAGVLAELKEELRRVGAYDAASSVRVRRLPDQDWNARWAMSVEPINIGRGFRIRQSWNSPDPSFDGIELIIDPKRAFGTGYHATTQLIVAWLEDHIRGGESVLDVGTGTGILAMAALRLGAASALGIDNDPVAVECACENAAANGFGRELRLLTTAVEDLGAETFDVIVANLDHNTILEIHRHLRGRLKAGGAVCLSGIQTDNVQDIAVFLAAIGGRIVERRVLDEWVAVAVQF